MSSLPPSFFDGFSNWLELATFDTNQELRAMRRRLIEPAFIDGQMRPAGYEFEDSSAGPHRRNDDGGFAYHPQFVDIPAMSMMDRLKAKALEARSIAPKAIADFEKDLDDLIAEGPKLASERAEAVGMHHEAFAGVRGELGGLRDAMGILSNGGPSLDPLQESAPAAPSSEALKV